MTSISPGLIDVGLHFRADLLGVGRLKFSGQVAQSIKSHLLCTDCRSGFDRVSALRSGFAYPCFEPEQMTQFETPLGSNQPSSFETS